LPNPAGGMALDRRFRASRLFCGNMGFENVEAHDVPDGIVENKTKEVEFDDRMEPASKVVEQRGEIALLGDGLADFEQGFKLTPGVFERGGKRHFRRRDHGIRHRRQDSTRVGEGSTGGGPLSAVRPNRSHYSRASDQSWGSGNETAQTNYYRE